MSRSPRRVDGYAPIGDYAVLGDGRTVALVALDGSVDWLCLPAFDAPPVFDAILDAPAGNRFSLEPVGPFTAERRYRPGTNILETTITTDGGSVRLTDAVTLRQGGGLVPWFELARRIEWLTGEVRLAWRVAFGDRLGAGRPRFRTRGPAPVAEADGLYLAVLVWGGEPPLASDATAEGELAGTEGDSALLALVAVERGPVPLPERGDVERRMETTEALWRQWSDAHEWNGPYGEPVLRSLLTLELMTSVETGAVVAAPTCSLPERIGGARNYDYRYAWTRDTTFTLDAFMQAGRREQAHASLAWMLGAVRTTHPRVQPIYRLDGSVLHDQQDLALPGYRGSRPVVVGNSAAGQLQLGSYGDLLETAFLYARAGNALDPETAAALARTVDFLREIWRRDDSSFWEIDPAPFTFSKLAAWVAFDRAIELAEEGALPAARLGAWRQEREAIRAWVEERSWSGARGAYVQAAGSEKLDAAVLLAARMGFADPAGERFLSTVGAIRQELGRGPLLYRYSGMAGEEGCFLACSFWLVEALARGGRVDEATALMDELVALGNDVGLYSEEIDPDSRELLGNFPQGLTHLSLVNAAASLAEAGRER